MLLSEQIGEKEKTIFWVIGAWSWSSKVCAREWAASVEQTGLFGDNKVKYLRSQVSFAVLTD